MDKMAKMWAPMSRGDPPHSFFAKLRKEFGEELVLGMTKRLYLSEKQVDGDFKAYLTAACTAHNERQEAALKERVYTPPENMKWLFDEERQDDRAASTP